MSFLKRPFQYFAKGRNFFLDAHYKDVKTRVKLFTKSPYRTEIINFLLSLKQGETKYLEIGVRNPNDNFNKINASKKFSVDPGLEFRENPVDFKMTSDEFFQKLTTNEVLTNDIKFDVIFIDGLHLAEQATKDIENALKYIDEDGFIVLHDCNPPSEWHARENYSYHHTPAGGGWNGTTWKAFFKWRQNPSLYSCCIDSDWGVGILSKTHDIDKSTSFQNEFYEFSILEENRKELLNLIDFDTLKKMLG